MKAPRLAIGLLLAIVCLAHGDEARDRYEEMLLRSPRPGAAFDKVYLSYLEGEGLEALNGRWQERATQGADQAKYLLLLGLLSERRGDAAEAEKQLLLSAGKDASLAESWRALARLQERSNRPVQAALSLEKALTATQAAEERLEIFRALANLEQRAMHREAAIAVWKRALAEFANDDDVAIEAADALAENGNFDEASKILEGLLAKPAGDPFRRMQIELRFGTFEEATGRSTKAVERYARLLDETSETSWVNRELRGRIETVFRRRDDLPALASYYEERLKTRPTETASARGLSDVLFELGKKEESLSWLEKASSARPDDKELEEELARRYAETGAFDKAAAIFDRLAGQARQPADLLEHLGDAYWAKYQKTETKADQEAALAAWRRLAKPPEAAAHFRLAGIFRRHQLDKEAEEQFRKAIALDPAAADPREQLGILLLEQKRDEEAWKLLEALVPSEKPSAADFLRLARLQQRFEKHDEALQTVERGLKAHQNQADLLEFQYRMLVTMKRPDDAMAVCDAVIASADSPQIVEEAESRKAALLVQTEKQKGWIEEKQKRLEGNEPVLESDLRVLVRLLLNGDASGLPGIFARAGKDYPNSIPFLALEAEAAARRNDTDGRIAILRRLASLDIQRKSAWLQEIARTYQGRNQPAEAISAARDVVEASPTDAAAYLFAAGIAAQAKDLPQAEKWYRAAARLAESPRDALQQLAAMYSANQRHDEAVATYEEAFEQEKDPESKLAITTPLAMAYIQAGRSGEIIQRFRERQRSESEDGWRYALYLSQIFRSMQDYTAAREELTKALAARPRDARLIRQLIDLSRYEGSSEKELLYFRRLAEVEPSANNDLALADALIRHSKTEEAWPLIEKRSADLLAQPMLFQALVVATAKSAIGDQVSALLNKMLSADPANLQLKLQTITLKALSGQTAEAARMAFSLYEDCYREVGGEFTSPANFVIYFSLPGTFGGTRQNNWLYRQAYCLSNAMMLQQALMSGGRAFMSSFPQTQAKVKDPKQPLMQVRDTALGWAGLFVEQSGDAALKAELAERIKTSGAPDGEQLLAGAILGDAAGSASAISRLIAQTHPDQNLVDFALSLLSANVVQCEDKVALEKTLLERRGETAADAAGVPVSTILAYRDIGEPAKAHDLLMKNIAAVDSKSNPYMIFQYAPLALQEDDLTAFNAVLERMRKMRTGTSPAYYTSPLTILSQLFYYSSNPKQSGLTGEIKHLEEATEALLKMAWENPSPSSSANASGAFRQLRRYGGDQNVFVPCRYLTAENLMYSQGTFQQLRQKIGRDKLNAIVDRQIASLKGPAKDTARFYKAIFDFQDGNKESALAIVGDIAGRDDDPGLQLNYAVLLNRNGKAAEAIPLLEKVSPSDRDYYELAQMELASATHQAGDRAKALATLERVRQFNLSPNENQRINALAGQINAKAPADAKKVAAIPPSQSTSRSQYERVNEMQAARSAGDKETAIRMAEELLAEDVLAAGGPDRYDYVRSCCEVLYQSQSLAKHVRQWEKELEQSPTSQRLIYILAVATPITNTYKASSKGRDDLGGPLWVRLAREGNFFRGFISRDGKSWELIHGQEINLPAKILVGCSFSGGSSENPGKVVFENITLEGTVTPASGGISAGPWQFFSIGKMKQPGTASVNESNGALTLTTTGNDIWENRDAFSFACQQLEGDGEITAYVASTDAPNEWSKIGVMMRATAEADSPFAMMVTTPSTHVALQWRKASDPSLKYWKQLAETRSGDMNFQLRYAGELVTRGKADQAIAICQEVARKDPTSLMANSYTVTRIYADAGREADLVSIVDTLKPYSDPRGDDQQINFVCNLADTFRGKKQYDEAIRIYRKGRELVSPRNSYRSNQVHYGLLRTLAEAGQREEFEKYFLEVAFPSKEAREKSASSQSLMGQATRNFFGADEDRGSLFLADGISYGGSGLTASSARFLKLARDQKFLPALAAAAKKNMETDSDSPRTWAIEGVLAAARDPSALAFIKKMAAAPTPALEDFRRLIGWVFLVNECFTWPEAAPFAYTMLQKAATNNNMQDGQMKNRLALWYASEARERKDPKGAEKALSNLHDSLRVSASSGSPYNLDVSAAQFCIRELIGRGKDQDAANLLEAARTSNRRQNNERSRELDRLEAYLLARNAKMPLAGALWADISGKQATVHWQFVPEKWVVANKPTTAIFLPEEAVPLGDKRKLILQAGPAADKLAPVAEIMAAPNGVWSGTLPADALYLRADLQDAPDQTTVSNLVVIPSSDNLLKNPRLEGTVKLTPGKESQIPGWTIANCAQWTSSKKGALRVKTEMDTDLTLVSEKIPVVAGKSYQVDSWVRFDTFARADVDLTVLLFDAEGKQVGRTEATLLSTSEWQNPRIFLAPAAREHFVVISPKARSMAVRLTVRGTAEIRDVALREVPNAAVAAK